LTGLQDLFCTSQEYTGPYFLLRPLRTDFKHAFVVLSHKVSDLMQILARMA
jgi:hypothetical protein